MTRLVSTLALALGLSLFSLTALAEPAPEEPVSAAEERAASFRAVTGPEAESVPGGALLIAAYIALWALALGYLLRLGKIAGAISRDTERLHASLEKIDDVR